MSTVPFESRYAVVESSGSPIADVIFPSSGMARRVILAVGHTLQPSIAFKLTAAGFAVHSVRSTKEARAFLGERIPVAMVLAVPHADDPLLLVRWVHDQARLTFVQIFLTPVGPSIAEAIRAGVDDVFDLIDDDASDCIMARIERAESLAQLALLDPLTQLHNRRFMNDRLQSEVARAHRSGAVFSLALVDLDDFKTINDTFGHMAGDRALVAFARALRRDLREYDVTCRFGGDEFIVLFPDCDAANARRALAKLRKDSDWYICGLPMVTFSAGIAEFPEDGDSWTALFEVSDCNLLCAKNGGRNRTFGGPTAQAAAE